MSLAENGFDPPTSGLWAQHASTAPLCFVVIVPTSIVAVVSRFTVLSYLGALKPGFAYSHLLKMFLRPNSWQLVCTVFKKWHLGHLVTCVHSSLALRLLVYKSDNAKPHYVTLLNSYHLLLTHFDFVHRLQYFTARRPYSQQNYANSIFCQWCLFFFNIQSFFFVRIQFHQRLELVC